MEKNFRIFLKELSEGSVKISQACYISNVDEIS